MRLGLVGAVLLLGLAVPLPALAGAFNVVPVKLELGPRAATAVLQVTNQAAEPVTVQVTAKAWSQDDRGQPVYVDTGDLVVFPKILAIDAGEERVIRVAYQGPAAGAAERTYRLFLEELPAPDRPAAGLSMTLRLGVPVFVAPAKTRSGAEVAAVALDHGALAFTVANRGNTHLVIGRITARGTDAAGKERFQVTGNGWYVLAGRRRTFTLALPADGCRASRVIELRAEAGDTALAGHLDVDPARCAPAP